MVNLPFLDVPTVDYGPDEAEMARYRADGTARALAMDNRGPVRFGADGKLDPAILDAYSRHGFYILENVVDAAELADIERDLADLLDRAPVTKDAEVDRHGRPSFVAGQKSRPLRWVKPLSDPLGGTDASYGRHPAKMTEPEAPKNAPDYVLQLIHGSLQHSEACLRLYGHPQLLAVAEAINGPDFAPFNEAIWIKQPRLGGSVAWHQDGWTHWDDPALDEGTHGFNFMVQLYGCDAANGLWVIPGSHRNGKADIMALVQAAGSDRLPEAVPFICGPGDVAISNRQVIHGSFANTSPNVRVTLNMGFHRRKSVLGVKSGGVHNPVSLYDEAYIHNRARLIQYGIDARRQHFPDEVPYSYAPLADCVEQYRWSPAVSADIRDYNLQDIGI
ncbi:MAG: phytanoyl-CoA dioxygenase family protein [Alphaproteobacteria bacterium]|nr:phytanoyl-CoA dioxygenase family protein [Alphaproteobacteria bacterium]